MSEAYPKPRLASAAPPVSEDPPITEPMPAPEIFVEGFANASVRHGVAKFPFFSIVRTEAEERRVAAHLVMPIGTVLAVHEAFGNLIEQLKDQGIIAQQVQ